MSGVSLTIPSINVNFDGISSSAMNYWAENPQATRSRSKRVAFMLACLVL
jgi:hypothetical protein